MVVCAEFFVYSLSVVSTAVFVIDILRCSETYAAQLRVSLVSVPCSGKVCS